MKRHIDHDLEYTRTIYQHPTEGFSRINPLASIFHLGKIPFSFGFFRQTNNSKHWYDLITAVELRGRCVHITPAFFYNPCRPAPGPARENKNLMPYTGYSICRSFRDPTTTCQCKIRPRPTNDPWLSKTASSPNK